MILVTGGAGYVGSAVMRRLGRRAVAIDNLSNSARPIHEQGRFYEIDIGEAPPELVRSASAYVHCAGRISPRESQERSEDYWRTNVGAAFSFFRHATPGAPLVFSSSCSVYGRPRSIPIREDHPTEPVSVYGWTKLACEKMLGQSDLRLSVLRYFNVAGGMESHADEIHLIPRAVLAAIRGEPFTVYGDGRQVRDFVHVDDLAEAHVLALEKPGTFNLGSGEGTSVNEVLALVETVTGRAVRRIHAPAHPADPQELVADITRARMVLGWAPRRTLSQMVSETWEHLRSR